MRRVWPQPLALLLATAAAIDCPGGTSLVDLFNLNGTRWAACEDLQVPGGALALVSSSGTTEWFHKTHETYGSAPLGSDDASYYLNLTKKAAVEDKTDVLAVRLLATEEGLTWSRVASVVPPIRHAGVRTFVGSRGGPCLRPVQMYWCLAMRSGANFRPQQEHGTRPSASTG